MVNSFEEIGTELSHMPSAYELNGLRFQVGKQVPDEHSSFLTMA